MLKPKYILYFIILNLIFTSLDTMVFLTYYIFLYGYINSFLYFLCLYILAYYRILLPFLIFYFFLCYYTIDIAGYRLWKFFGFNLVPLKYKIVYYRLKLLFKPLYYYLTVIALFVFIIISLYHEIFFLFIILLVIFNIFISYWIYASFCINKLNWFINFLLIILINIFIYLFSVETSINLNKNENIFININDQNGYRIEFRYSHEKDIEEAFLQEEKKKDEKNEEISNRFSLDIIKSKIGLSSYIMKGSKKLKPKEVLLNKSLNDFVENKIKYYYKNIKIINKDLEQSINYISKDEEEINLLVDKNIIKNNSNIVLNEKIEKINKVKVKKVDLIINEKKKESKFYQKKIAKYLDIKMSKRFNEYVKYNLLYRTKNKFKSNGDLNNTELKEWINTFLLNKKKRSKFNKTKIDKDLLNYINKDKHLNKKMTKKLNQYINFNLYKTKNKLKILKNNIINYKNEDSLNFSNLLQDINIIEADRTLDDLKEEAKKSFENINYDIEVKELNYKNYMYYKNVLYDELGTLRHYLPVCRNVEDWEFYLKRWKIDLIDLYKEKYNKELLNEDNKDNNFKLDFYNMLYERSKIIRDDFTFIDWIKYPYKKNNNDKLYNKGNYGSLDEFLVNYKQNEEEYQKALNLAYNEIISQRSIKEILSFSKVVDTRDMLSFKEKFSFKKWFNSTSVAIIKESKSWLKKKNIYNEILENQQNYFMDKTNEIIKSDESIVELSIRSHTFYNRQYIRQLLVKNQLYNIYYKGDLGLNQEVLENDKELEEDLEKIIKNNEYKFKNGIK